MTEKQIPLTLDLIPEMQQCLEEAATRLGISVEQYCLSILAKELGLAQPEAVAAARRKAAADFLDRLELLHAEIFGGQTLPGDSTDLIRKAREIRDEEIHG